MCACSFRFGMAVFVVEMGMNIADLWRVFADDSCIVSRSRVDDDDGLVLLLIMRRCSHASYDHTSVTICWHPTSVVGPAT